MKIIQEGKPLRGRYARWDCKNCEAIIESELYEMAGGNICLGNALTHVSNICPICNSQNYVPIGDYKEREGVFKSYGGE